MKVLEVDDLGIEYAASRGGALSRKRLRLRAVDGASFEIEAGSTLGLVGESGSGKTSVARAVLGLVPISAGNVWLLDRSLRTDRGSLRRVRRHVQMVFQQPSGSLDPRMAVKRSVAEPLVHLLGLRGQELHDRVMDLLRIVGLDSTQAERRPRELSGGQRQRVAIARAIATSPDLVICDEPTSSLDVSVQAQIINLLLRLQSELGLSYLFISHDLGIVRQIADYVAVMHHGKIVETGASSSILSNPTHPYTQRLLGAVPKLDRIGRI